MSENLEWKKIKLKFTINSVMRELPRRFKLRLNSANTSNLIAKENFNEKLIEKDDTTNLLDVITRKVINDQKKIEIEESAPVQVNCEQLKSVFVEHEASNEEAGAREVTNQSKSRLGFISSNIAAELDSSDDVFEVTEEKKPVCKQLITKEIFDEWMNECTSTAPSNVYKQNQKDRGIFDKTPSLTTCSKIIVKKKRQLDSLLQ